jgi:hypothetical protein
MFSISPTILKKYPPTTNDNDKKEVNDAPEVKGQKFDLLNEDIIDLNENKIIEAPEYLYKVQFRLLLEANRYEIEDLLDYHYSKSKNSELFYNYVKVDLSRNSTLDIGIVNSIKEWLDKVINSPKVDKKEELEVINLEKPNDIIRSTIDDYLMEFKDGKCIDDENYIILSDVLTDYFKLGVFKNNLPQIIVRKVGIKKFAWVLYSLFKELNDNNLDINYLKFAKFNISLFKKVNFNENDKKKCNMYKYFTAKPK